MQTAKVQGNSVVGMIQAVVPAAASTDEISFGALLLQRSEIAGAQSKKPLVATSSAEPGCKLPQAVAAKSGTATADAAPAWSPISKPVGQAEKRIEKPGVDAPVAEPASALKEEQSAEDKNAELLASVETPNLQKSQPVVTREQKRTNVVSGAVSNSKGKHKVQQPDADKVSAPRVAESVLPAQADAVAAVQPVQVGAKEIPKPASGVDASATQKVSGTITSFVIKRQVDTPAIATAAVNPVNPAKEKSHDAETIKAAHTLAAEKPEQLGPNASQPATPFQPMLQHAITAQHAATNNGPAQADAVTHASSASTSPSPAQLQTEPRQRLEVQVQSDRYGALQVRAERDAEGRVHLIASTDAPAVHATLTSEVGQMRSYLEQGSVTVASVRVEQAETVQRPAATQGGGMDLSANTGSPQQQKQDNGQKQNRVLLDTAATETYPQPLAQQGIGTQGSGWINLHI